MAKQRKGTKRQPLSLPNGKPKRGRPRKPVVPVVPAGLTDKEARFVQEYCTDFNATQAAIRAGYSKKSAEKIGYEVRRKPEIDAAIEDFLRRAAERCEITHDELVGRLVPIIRANIFDFGRVTEQGDFVIDFAQVTRAKAEAIGEIEVHDYVDGRGEDARDVKRTKFKLYDKPSTVMNAAKLLGYVKDRVEHSGDVTVTTKKVDADAEARRLSDEQLEAAVQAGREYKARMAAILGEGA